MPPAATTPTTSWPDEIHRVLRTAGVGHVSYVPDAGHTTLINLCLADDDIRTNVLTTEEEGIALAADSWLGGVRSVVLMQSSGVGSWPTTPISRSPCSSASACSEASGGDRFGRHARPANLDLVVLDNGHYGETGMQLSHTGLGIDLAAVAAAAGFVDARLVASEANLARLVADGGAWGGGPRCFVVKIRTENPPRSVPARNAVFVKNRFRAHLGLAPN